MYRFYIDGTEWQEDGNISGWKSFKRTIQRINQNGDGVLVTMDSEVRFHGQMYDFFLNEFLTKEICNDYELMILESLDGVNYREFYTGKIFLTDFEFDERVKTAKVSVQDNSFYSRINNNKSIRTSPTAGKSKNGQDIDPCDIWDIQTFDTNTGTAYNTVEAIRAYDLMRYLVSFMSDDEMGFRSDVFDIGGEYEGAFVTTGFSLRTETFDEVPFEVGWADVITELYKNFNIAFEIAIDPVTLSPVLRVEKQSDLYVDDVAFSFDEPLNFKIRYKKETLYAKIKIGSSIVSEPQQTYLPFPEGLNILSFKPEEYHMLGQCNIDSELDLQRQWIVSSNIIHDINIELEEGWDDEMALVMCDNLNTGTLTATAKRTNALTGASSPLFYNEDLYSSNCLLRFYGAIPNTIIKYLGTQDNTFLALLGSNITYNTPNWPGNTAIEPYPFADETTPPAYDAGNNYNNATYRYTAPITGLYSFEAKLNYQAIVSLNGLVDLRLRLKRYNASNVLISESLSVADHFNSTTPSMIVNNSLLVNLNTFMTANDYVVVRLEYTILNIAGSTSVTIWNDSYIACTNAHNFGGAFQTFDPKDYRALNFSFESDMTQSDIQTVLQNKKNKFAVIHFGKRYEGWLEKCTIHSSPERQTAEVTLISSLNYSN